MQYEVAVRPASPPHSPWPTAALVLLAVVLGAVMAWQIRDWSSYLDVRLRSLPGLTAGAGHHSAAEKTLAPPPAIVANAIANFAGITLLAAHATMASLLLAVVASRRWAAGRITALLVFAATSAVLCASVTIPLAGLTVGNAIAPGNTMSAAITVLQYSFVLSLLAAVTPHLRRSPRIPGGDRRAEQKRCDQARVRRRRGPGLPGETAGVRVLRRPAAGTALLGAVVDPPGAEAHAEHRGHRLLRHADRRD